MLILLALHNVHLPFLIRKVLWDPSPWDPVPGESCWRTPFDLT